MTREDILLITLQSGALLIVIWGIFRLFPTIPANSKAWIWRLAFLKPLLSLLPFAVITLHVLPSNPVVSEPVADVGISRVKTPASLSSTEIARESAASQRSNADPILILWILGVCATAGYGLWGLGKAILIIRSATPITQPELQEALVDLMDRAGVEPPINLLASPLVQSAMLVGGFRPTIVLPTSAVEEGSTSDLRLMLAHEIAHIARRDLTWFGVTSAVQTLFFFNPVVWLAAKCSRLDHESATDRYAAQLAGVPIHAYADMLLRATVAARIGLAPGTLRMAASYRTIHRRLEAMKHFNLKPSVGRKSAIAALALVTCGLLPTYQLAQAQSKIEPEKKVIAKKPSSKLVKPATAKAKPSNYGVWMQGKGKGKKQAWVTSDSKDKVDVFAWNGKEYVKIKQITRAQFEKERAQLLKESAKMKKSAGNAPPPKTLKPGSAVGSSSSGKASTGQGVATAGAGRNATGGTVAPASQGQGSAVGGSGQASAGSGSNVGASGQGGGVAVGGSGISGSGSARSGQGSGTAVGGSGQNSASSGVAVGSGQNSGAGRGNSRSRGSGQSSGGSRGSSGSGGSGQGGPA